MSLRLIASTSEYSVGAGSGWSLPGSLLLSSSPPPQATAKMTVSNTVERTNNLGRLLGACKRKAGIPSSYLPNVSPNVGAGCIITLTCALCCSEHRATLEYIYEGK